MLLRPVLPTFGQYFIRPAETYLLRAEGHLGAGDAAKAAEDINVIRARANAKLATATDMNVAPHNNLFPIPYSEIERNTGAVLEQNPGYSSR